MLSSSKDGLERFILTEQTVEQPQNFWGHTGCLENIKSILQGVFHCIRFSNEPCYFGCYWSAFQELSHSTHFCICQNSRLSGQETEVGRHRCCLKRHYARKSQGQVLLPTPFSPSSCLCSQMSDLIFITLVVLGGIFELKHLKKPYKMVGSGFT